MPRRSFSHIPSGKAQKEEEEKQFGEGEPGNISGIPLAGAAAFPFGIPEHLRSCGKENAQTDTSISTNSS